MQVHEELLAQAAAEFDAAVARGGGEGGGGEGVGGGDVFESESEREAVRLLQVRRQRVCAGVCPCQEEACVCWCVLVWGGPSFADGCACLR